MPQFTDTLFFDAADQSGAGDSWSDLENALNDEDDVAIANVNPDEKTRVFEATGVKQAVASGSISLPPDMQGATITGVEFAYESTAHSNFIDDLVSLILNGNVVGDNKSLPDAHATGPFGYPTEYYWRVHGGSGDTWGVNLTAADIDGASDFGIALRHHNTGSTLPRDMRIRRLRVSFEYEITSVSKIYAGPGLVTGVYLGSNPVPAVYKGSTKVWG